MFTTMTNGTVFLKSNNAFAFPGIGLGAIAVKAKRISDDMLWAATHALSKCSPAHQDKMAPILPKLAEAKNGKC